nr:hypothetical protein [Butyrivibrio sp. AE3006]
MKAKQVRDTLLKEIRTVCKSIEQFCVSPGKDFVRNRKMPIEKLILTIIGMGSRNITNELLDFYDTSPDTPTASAFVQQRDKLKPEALETIFKSFSIKLLASSVKQMPSKPCTESPCGRMIHIYPEKNLRAYPRVLRGTEECKIRTTVEREINHMKDNFCLANRRTRNEKTLHADLILAGITQLISVVLADKIHHHEYIRSLKPLIA